MTEKDLDIAIEKCERIMEFDTRTLKNPVSENGLLFDSVYDLLKFLRQCQFKTSGMDDTISRQTVLDAVDGVTWYHQNKHGEMVSGANDDEHQAWYKAEDIYKAIEALPPAQPETAKRIVGKSRDGMTLWYQCDMCNEPVDVQDNYCRGCGRRLIDEQSD